MRVYMYLWIYASTCKYNAYVRTMYVRMLLIVDINIVTEAAPKLTNFDLSHNLINSLSSTNVTSNLIRILDLSYNDFTFLSSVSS